MIKNTTPLSMAEAKEFIKDDEINAFVKKFSKLDENQGKELREKLVSLNFMKLNDKHISKLIDSLPKDKEDLLKVLPDANLDENETNTIISTIKEFK